MSHWEIIYYYAYRDIYFFKGGYPPNAYELCRHLGLHTRGKYKSLEGCIPDPFAEYIEDKNHDDCITKYEIET